MRDEQSTGSSEIAALAQRVETARGKLPLQHDSALFEVLSEDEIVAERELAEWVRTQRRKQRRRAVEEELAAEHRDRKTAAQLRRTDEDDARWHRRALAARRRVSSQDARLAQLYRRAEWSSRALIAVVVLGMVWAGVNVQHNLVPSGDMSDPLYWLSYGIEAMISIPIITIMVAATTAARWGRELARGKVVFFETALLGTTIALNAGPHLASGSFGKAAEYAIAPVMVGVVIWLHAWVSARYALLIDGAPVVDQDPGVIRRHIEREQHVGITLGASDDRAWLPAGVEASGELPGTAIGYRGPVVSPVHEHGVAEGAYQLAHNGFGTDNSHLVQATSATNHLTPTYTAQTNGHATEEFSAANGQALADESEAAAPAVNGHAVQKFSAVNGHTQAHTAEAAGPADVESAAQAHRTPGSTSAAVNGRSTIAGHLLPHASGAASSSAPSTNGLAMHEFSANNGQSLPYSAGPTNSAAPTDNHVAQEFSAYKDQSRSAPFQASNGQAAQSHSANGASRSIPTSGEDSLGAPATNGHEVRFGSDGLGASESHRRTTNGHSAAVNGHPLPAQAQTAPWERLSMNGHAAQSVSGDGGDDQSTQQPPTTSQINGQVAHPRPTNYADDHTAVQQSGLAASSTNSETVTNGHRANGHAVPSNGHTLTGGDDASHTNGYAIPANGRAVGNGNGNPVNGYPASTDGPTLRNDDAAHTNGSPVNGRTVATNGRAVTNGGDTDGRTVSTNGRAVDHGDDTTHHNGYAVNERTAHANGRGLNDEDGVRGNGHGGPNGHSIPLFSVNDAARGRTESGTNGAPMHEPTTDSPRGDDSEEPHPGDPIRKAAATIADTVAQAISGEPAPKGAPSRRKSAAPNGGRATDAEVDQLVFEEPAEQARPLVRVEPTSVVGRGYAQPEPIDFDEDTDDEINEDDEISVIAHEISRRRMSNLPVGQLAEILRLADESWLTPGIANEVGVSRAAVDRAVEAAIKVRRPYAISG